MPNHYTARIDTLEAREKLRASHHWTVEDHPEDKRIDARLRLFGPKRDRISLYYNSNLTERVKTETTPHPRVWVALELTLGVEFVNLQPEDEDGPDGPPTWYRSWYRNDDERIAKMRETIAAEFDSRRGPYETPAWEPDPPKVPEESTDPAPWRIDPDSPMVVRCDDGASIAFNPDRETWELHIPGSTDCKPSRPWEDVDRAIEELAGFYRDHLKAGAERDKLHSWLLRLGTFSPIQPSRGGFEVTFPDGFVANISPGFDDKGIRDDFIKRLGES